MKVYTKSGGSTAATNFGFNIHYLHGGSYMSAHVLLNILSELGKRDKKLV